MEIRSNFYSILKKTSQSIDFSTYVPCKLAPVFKPEQVVKPVQWRAQSYLRSNLRASSQNLQKFVSYHQLKLYKRK